MKHPIAQMDSNQRKELIRVYSRTRDKQRKLYGKQFTIVSDVEPNIHLEKKSIK